MKQIWKYQVGPGRDIISMPRGAHVLSVQNQSGAACLWVLVDPEAGGEERAFRTVGTGHEFNADDLKYVGTFQMNNGSLVFHTFEEQPSGDERDPG